MSICTYPLRHVRSCRPLGAALRSNKCLLESEQRTAFAHLTTATLVELVGEVSELVPMEELERTL